MGHSSPSTYRPCGSLFSPRYRQDSRTESRESLDWGSYAFWLSSPGCLSLGQLLSISGPPFSHLPHRVTKCEHEVL